MAEARKFGTFSGVFTPSILTILGVIMYLRLPSIVGQAGLFQTLGIIAVAHIISIATGLSVSSIATDKKVKAGGTYYMISRSLGLPIGGTLGLALFTGLSFSVSLYVIGFAESFLSFWQLPVTINSIRVTGTITLLLVTTVTVISTALALRTQFYIMAAIALSLLSILFGRHEFAPAEALLQPIATAAPFIVLFGIFFPAVTGFEAGVSMSGDLKDPKRSIPGGTISAIAVGLIVYMGLATFLSLTVDSAQLVGNPRVLLDIALFPPLVIAGVWGATISSAFGSILGAPRILQATSVDGITPRWFSVGYGKENEPRHALVLAFIIAEAGILIGQLDVIARIVSMFFITTYGFLNLSAAIESWVSPDFRPEFRVPRAVGFVGAAACFLVMIQLDFLAMIGASLLLGALYAWLARRQLRLETGDAWEGVWSTLARAALHRLDRGQQHKRNWRPNILLFSGGTKARPHLVEFGRQLVGKRGVLTNFDLVRTRSPDGPRRPVPVEDDAQPNGTPYGVFSRRVECGDVYEGMEQISAQYGFAGIEPNTVVLGWGRNAREPDRFVATIQSLAERDLNVLLLDYHEERGWGRHARIDVWWRLTGSDVALSLALLRFVTTSDDWRDAEVRFLTVNDGEAALGPGIRRDMLRVLDEHRVEAAVRVINNGVEQRPFQDLIRSESIDADLTILGLNDLGSRDGARFVEETNRIVDALGTIVMVHASSFFSEPLVRVPASLPEETRIEAPSGAEVFEKFEAFEAPFQAVTALCTRLEPQVRVAFGQVHDEYLGRAFGLSQHWVEDAGEFAAATLEALEAELATGEGFQAIGRARSMLIEGFGARMAESRSATLPAQSALLAGALEALPAEVAAIAVTAPERLTVEPPLESLRPASRDPIPVALAKARLRWAARLRRPPPAYTTPARRIVESTFRQAAAGAVQDGLSAFASDAALAVAHVQRLLDATLEALDRIAHQLSGGEPVTSLASIEAEAARSTTLDLSGIHAAAAERSRRGWIGAAHEAVRRAGEEASRLDVRRAEREAGARLNAGAAGLAEAEQRTTAWDPVQVLVWNGADLHVRLAAMRRRVTRIEAETRAAIRRTIDHELLEPLIALRDRIGRASGRLDDEEAAAIQAATSSRSSFQTDALIEALRAAVTTALEDVPEAVQTLADESVEAVAQGRIEDVEPATVPLARGTEYIIETELISPLQQRLPAVATVVEGASEVGREVARLVAFQLGAESADTTEALEHAGAILGGAIERIDREIARARDSLEEVEQVVGRAVDRTLDRLEPYSVRRATAKLQGYRRDRRERALIGGADRVRRWLVEGVGGRIIRLVYQRSESILLARRLRRGSIIEPGSLAKIRERVEQVAPDPDILGQLPYFYRQLFLSRPAVTEDLLIPFDTEMEEIGAAVELHRRGKPGGLLILADHGSGRATVSSLIAQRHCRPDSIFRVDPLDGGSVDVDAFERQLGRAIGRARSSASRMLAGLPAGSAIIVNQLGLWWERSPGGFAVIERLVELIAKHTDRVLFIVSANTRAFRLMNRIRPIEDQFLRVVEIEPFTSRQLRDALLLRHDSTGLRLEIDGRSGPDLTEWRIARFFSALFEVSGGNIGVALSTWIASIRAVDAGHVHLETPRRPVLDAFRALGSLQLMLLVQLALHDSMTLDRLARVTGLDRSTLNREVRTLEQAGVIVRDAGGVVRMDRFVRPHVVGFLVQAELL